MSTVVLFVHLLLSPSTYVGGGSGRDRVPTLRHPPPRDVGLQWERDPRRRRLQEGSCPNPSSPTAARSLAHTTHTLISLYPRAPVLGARSAVQRTKHLNRRSRCFSCLRTHARSGGAGEARSLPGFFAARAEKRTSAKRARFRCAAARRHVRPSSEPFVTRFRRVMSASGGSERALRTCFGADYFACRCSVVSFGSSYSRRRKKSWLGP